MELDVNKRRFRCDQFTDPFNHKVVDLTVPNLIHVSEKALGRENVLRKELRKRDEALRAAVKDRDSLAAICDELTAKSALLRAENEALLRMNSLIIDKRVKIP